MDDKTLLGMQQADIKTVNPDEMVDICGIEIDRNQPIEKRIKSYMAQVHNPYLVRVGEYIVKIGYLDCEETFNERMKQYISKMTEWRLR